MTQIVDSIRRRVEFGLVNRFVSNRIWVCAPDSPGLADALADRGGDVIRVETYPAGAWGRDGGGSHSGLLTEGDRPEGGVDTAIYLPSPAESLDSLEIRGVLGLVNPTGRVIFRLTTSEDGSALDARLARVEATLQAAGATLTHVFPYGVFDDNPWLASLLGSSLGDAIGEIERSFQEPGAEEFWAFVEQYVLPFAPIGFTRHVLLVVERTPPELAESWRLRPRLGSLPCVSKDALQHVMGPAFSEFSLLLRERVAPVGALRLLLAIEQRIGSLLPVPIDVLSLLTEEDRARILDHLAWRWAQQWPSLLPEALMDGRGIELAPLLEYSVYQGFIPALRPLR